MQLGLQMRNAVLEILSEILNEWRKTIEGLEDQFHLPIFDVTAVDSPDLDVLILDVPILENSCDGAQTCRSKKTQSREGMGIVTGRSFDSRETR